MDLSGKVALVTGSTTGIGEACARAFAAKGASVVVTGRDETRGNNVCDAIARDGGSALFIRAEVSDPDQCDRLVSDTVKRLGGLDILVNNAGILHSGNVVETSDDAWNETLAVNISGVFYMSRAAIRHMAAHGGGSIVNTASEWGLNGEPGYLAYCTSKGAVVQMTRCMALDHAQDGIRVNAVCPGEVHTQLLDDMLREQGGDLEENLKAFAAGIPMKRIAKPDEIARCVVFLASDDASYVTGTNFVVDGGNDATAGAYSG